MGAMSELDIILTQASEKAEAGSRRLRAAYNAVANFRECFTDPHDFDEAIAELSGAHADAYDAAVDLPIELRQFFDEPDPVPTETEPQLVTLVKEIHEKLVNGTVTNYSPGAVVEHPPTGYGVRIYYADGTMEEIHDVDGVQLANLNDGTFPFGFMNIEEDDQDGPGGHRAGYWDEDGRFEPFSDREQPRPGW